MAIDYIRAGIAVGIVVGSWILAYIVTFIISKIAKIASKSKTRIDDIVINNLRAPVKVVLLLIGLFVALKYAGLDFTYKTVTLDSIFIVIFILVGGFVITRVIHSLIRWYIEDIAPKTKGKGDEQIFPFIDKILRIVVYIIAVLMILQVLGIEIGPLLAGLGIAGLAVALALQDTLASFFSAVYIAADRPVNIGDYIEIEGGIKGYVKDISWRSTRIKTLGNNTIIVPNTKLASSVITNYDHPVSKLSVGVSCGVAYGSDLAKVEKIVNETARKVMKKVPGGSKTDEALMRFKEFGDSSINFRIFLKANKYADQFLLSHEFMKALDKAFRKAKIEIPFPQRDVHMKKK